MEVVVVDATKLNKLARFSFRGYGQIESFFLKLKAQGKALVAPEITVVRAWESFRRKTALSEEEKVKALYLGKVELLIDRVVPARLYEDFLEVADSVLKDDDPEKEDAHVLACALAYRALGLKTAIWSDDRDFLLKARLLKEKFSVEVFSLA